MAARQGGLTLVQYIAIRGDLVDKWPLGAVIAQACHASSAALHVFRDDVSTQEYLSDINRMHKVVLRVRDKNYQSLTYNCICFISAKHRSRSRLPLKKAGRGRQRVQIVGGATRELPNMPSNQALSQSWHSRILQKVQTPQMNTKYKRTSWYQMQNEVKYGDTHVSFPLSPNYWHRSVLRSCSVPVVVYYLPAVHPGTVDIGFKLVSISWVLFSLVAVNESKL